jgi:hypothetical protein
MGAGQRIGEWNGASTADLLHEQLKAVSRLRRVGHDLAVGRERRVELELLIERHSVGRARYQIAGIPLS